MSNTTDLKAKLDALAQAAKVQQRDADQAARAAVPPVDAGPAAPTIVVQRDLPSR